MRRRRRQRHFSLKNREFQQAEFFRPPALWRLLHRTCWRVALTPRHPRPLVTHAPPRLDQWENRRTRRSNRTSLRLSWTGSRRTTEGPGRTKNGDENPAHCKPFQCLAEKSAPSFPQIPPPCDTACTLAAGWIVYVAVRAGGRPPGPVVTCGGILGEAEAGGLRWQPDRPSREGRAKPATGSALASGFRHGEASGWTAGRACGGLRGLLAMEFVPDALHVPKPAASSGPRLWGKAAACRMRTSSGKSRAARALRHLGACTPCATHPIPEGKARVRPSGPEFPPQTPAACRAGILVRTGALPPGEGGPKGG